MVPERVKTVAAIDVGTNFLRMMIAQIHPDSKIVPLEDTWKATRIGRDTFSQGKIDVASVEDMCQTLKGFRSLMKDYQVKYYHAVATSAIREAENREYVLDQIKRSANLNVQVINNAEERFFLYKTIRDNIESIPAMRRQGILILHIGMGGIEVSIYSQGELKFTEHIKVGSLRLREMLSDLESRTLDFPSIIEEFVESKTYLLDNMIRSLSLHNMIGLGGELSNILALCRSHNFTTRQNYVPDKALTKLYLKIHPMTTEQIMNTYQLHRNEAEILLPSIIIFKHFLHMTHSLGIHVIASSLRQGLLANMVDEWFDTQRKSDFMHDIVSSVWFIGKNFAFDEKHARHVTDLSLSIFDQSKKIHKLGERERLYLQVAAILHDIGKYISLDLHHIISGQIMKAQEIMGFSNREVDLISNIIRYHGEENPLPSHTSFRHLDPGDKVIIGKLAAILKLADALDISHKQKVNDIKISISGREVLFLVNSRHEFLLEEWSVIGKSLFFEEVTGYKPIIKRKG